MAGRAFDGHHHRRWAGGGARPRRGVLARWPHPHLPAAAQLRWDLGDSRGTVAVRVPDNADAIELLGSTGPLAVSSANATGLPPATSVGQAIDMLGDAVDIYLDGGQSRGAVPSTIVDATGEVLIVRRQGVISYEALLEVVHTIQADEGLETL